MGTEPAPGPAAVGSQDLLRPEPARHLLAGTPGGADSVWLHSVVYLWARKHFPPERSSGPHFPQVEGRGNNHFINLQLSRGLRTPRVRGSPPHSPGGVLEADDRQQAELGSEP